MEFFTDGRIKKLRVINEFGATTTVYVANSLKDYTLENLIKEMKTLQIVKYENGNYCLVPANEHVNIEFDSTDDVELSLFENPEEIATAPYTIESSYSLRDFVKGFYMVRFGYSYNPIIEQNQSSCFFIYRSKKKGVVVYNPNKITFMEMKTNDHLCIVKMKSGHYYLRDTSKSYSNINFWQDSSNIKSYGDCMELRDLEMERNIAEEQKESLDEIRKLQEKRRNQFLFDVSGDDLSLMEDIW